MRSSQGVFQFKRFLIRQEQSAMKVTSDACLFGAWIDLKTGGKILDIGTGTGLLSLMAAQRTEASIDALEIEPDAAEEAKYNVRQSPWADRITVYPCSLAQFLENQRFWQHYDHIICNPPFYNEAWKSKSPKKRLAWHDDQLKLPAVLSAATILLREAGLLHLLIPHSSLDKLHHLCRQSCFSPVRICYMQSFSDRKPHRILLTLGRSNCQPEESVLVIFQGSEDYSVDYLNLLQPYLLNL